MKRLLFLWLFVPRFLFAQEDSAQERVYNFVEQMPHFPGNDESAIRFIKENFRVSAEDIERFPRGQIWVVFVISEDGYPVNPRVTRGLTPVLNEEALRVIRMMRYIPGKQNGKPVRVNFCQPIMLNYD